MKPNTKLTRHEPLGDGYDECLVIGPSPVSQPGPSAWPTSGGHSFVVSPVEFGENIVMPADYIMQNFAVIPPPDAPVETRTVTPTYTDQPSPEAVFAAHAKANPPVAVQAKPAPVPLTKEEIAAKRAAAKAGKP